MHKRIEQNLRDICSLQMLLRETYEKAALFVQVSIRRTRSALRAKEVLSICAK